MCCLQSGGGGGGGSSATARADGQRTAGSRRAADSTTSTGDKHWRHPLAAMLTIRCRSTDRHRTAGCICLRDESIKFTDNFACFSSTFFFKFTSNWPSDPSRYFRVQAARDWTTARCGNVSSRYQFSLSPCCFRIFWLGHPPVSGIGIVGIVAQICVRKWVP